MQDASATLVEDEAEPAAGEALKALDACLATMELEVATVLEVALVIKAADEDLVDVLADV